MPARATWAVVAVAAAILAAPAARAQEVTQVTPTPPTGCWKLTVTPDATSKVGGRLEFDEYIYFEGLTFTGQEIARLGFSPSPITPGTNALGQTTFTVTLSSGTQGNITASGVYLTTSMSGTFSWVRDGKTYVYNFTGAPFTPAVNPES
jgi:hypothetical protein